MHIHTHTRAHTHTHTHTHTGQISGLWAALLCISGGTWSYQGSLIRYIFIKFSNWKRASQGKRNMLIGREYSSLLTSLCPSICNPHPPHLLPPSISPSLHLTGGPQWRQTKSWGCWESGTVMGNCGREKEAGKRGWRRKGNVSPSAEQKNGVCASCERGEIAFSFHFTRLPFPVQPSSFTSRPLLHTLTQTHTHTHALTCPVLILWLWGEARRVCVSQS